MHLGIVWYCMCGENPPTFVYQVGIIFILFTMGSPSMNPLSGICKVLAILFWQMENKMFQQVYSDVNVHFGVMYHSKFASALL